MNASASPSFDPALIARYDVPGPRYTSYPSAPHFAEDFGERQWLEAIERSNRRPSPAPLSLYVHVPFCASPCFYCGCNRIITRDSRRGDRYLDYLDRESRWLGGLFEPHRLVRQLHLGGGTPNFLDIAQIGRLMDSLGRHFRLEPASTREFGIEIDPRFADADYIRALATMGFNRLSLGVQDFDPQVQRAVNREHGAAAVARLIHAARASGFRSISLDLIYGLPHQSVTSFSRTLEQVSVLAPDRVAVYSYAHLPAQFKAQRRLDGGALPDAATKLALFGRTLELLCAAGYRYIGMDHFALAGDDLVKAQQAGTLQRNFQGYSTFGDCDLVGLGVSAIGRIDDCYSQNLRDLPAYQAALDEGRLPVSKGHRLSQDDALRRAVIGELMCHGGLDTYAFGRRHGICFAERFADALQRLRTLAADGLVELGEGYIAVLPRGRLLLRQVAMCFDAYLGQGGAVRHSRAI